MTEDPGEPAVVPMHKHVKDFKFYVERSIRYHARRQAFFESFDKGINAANLILGSGTVVALLAKVPADLAVALTALVAIISFVNLTMRSSEMASKHSQLQQRYNDLLKQVVRLDPDKEICGDKLKSCVATRIDIERDEPPINRMVDLLAHNELVLAQGGPESHIWRIGWWKTLTANLVRYETNHIISIEQHREKSKK